MTALAWSAAAYVQFEDDRTRPVRDLVAAIPTTDPALVVDLGCGPGNSTEILAARYPSARVEAVDSSSDMLAAARKRLPAAAVTQADIATWTTSEPAGVLLANASLHWLPDHARLFPRLLAQLAEGGSLAVQMPDNLDEPAYVLMRELAEDPAWRDRIAAAQSKAGGKRGDLLTASDYLRLLRPLARRVDVWRTTYLHQLQGGAGAIVDWFQGSGLRPYLAPLEPGERDHFLARYRDAIARAYTILDDGTALLPFPRLFVIATR